MRRLLPLVLVLLAGCGKDDLCGDMVGSDTVCYTVHVGGSADNGDIDQLQVDTKYNEIQNSGSTVTITRRTIVGIDMRTTDMGSAQLPIAFPLLFQLPGQADESSRVIVVALGAGQPLGIGVGKLGVGQFGFDSPMLGSKHSVDVKLDPVSKDPCFDMKIFGGSLSDKTDRTCGGSTCQACTVNKGCNSTSDCVFPLTCQFVSGTSSELCQP